MSRLFLCFLYRLMESMEQPKFDFKQQLVIKHIKPIMGLMIVEHIVLVMGPSSL